jgi:hypothetical protein
MEWRPRMYKKAAERRAENRSNGMEHDDPEGQIE